jgi:hypothetical protein
MNEAKNRQYDIVVLFSALVRNSDGSFDEVEEKNGKSLFLGGQSGMDAAVDLASKVGVYIVVGGSKQKVDGMKNYLEESFEKNSINPKPKIIRMQSDQNTAGNLWALKGAFKEAGKLDVLEKKCVGFMTSAWHLLRVMRFAADIFGDVETHFIPIVAEAALVQYPPTFATYSSEFLSRFSEEVKGLKDWEEGKYRDQRKTEKEWPFVCYDKEILASLI